MVDEVAIRNAATVLLVRDGDAGLETLLLRRNAELVFHGGSWVFPGGRVDPADYEADVSSTGAEDAAHERAARRAAVREAHEEAAIVIGAESLVPFSHWTTPPGPPRRFATWFFLAPVDEGIVTTDGGEITDHRWFVPADALAAHRAREIELPPPTFVSLTRLASAQTVDDAIADARSTAYFRFEPQLHQVSGGFVSIYEGDVAYGDGARLDEPSPRHRLWSVDSGWRYERVPPDQNT